MDETLGIENGIDADHQKHAAANTSPPHHSCATTAEPKAQESCMKKVHVEVGDRFGTELRAGVDIAPGEMLLTEVAYCFASNEHDGDDDDTTLPSIVQAAWQALEKEKSLLASSITANKAPQTRTWKDLLTTQEQHPPDTKADCTHENRHKQQQQNASLFEWGAKQIVKRMSSSPATLSAAVESGFHQEALEAIQRVSLNAFAVKCRDSDRDHYPAWTANTITSDQELQQAIMSIGNDEVENDIGNAVFLLASAINHSCDPNAFVTFHRQHQERSSAPAAATAPGVTDPRSRRQQQHQGTGADSISISVRATCAIRAHEPITISYGPLVGGVDGNFRDRRAAITASGTQTFVCHCSACLEEEQQQEKGEALGIRNDAAAMLFIDTFITGARTTAEDALLESQRCVHEHWAPTMTTSSTATTPANNENGFCAQRHHNGAASSRHFGKAMSDTALQIIPYDVGLAAEFQKLAVQSIQLQQRNINSNTGNLAIAHELIKLSILRLFSGETEEGDNKSSELERIRDVERARGILTRYYGDAYPYRNLLESIIDTPPAQEPPK